MVILYSKLAFWYNLDTWSKVTSAACSEILIFGGSPTIVNGSTMFHGIGFRKPGLSKRSHGRRMAQNTRHYPTICKHVSQNKYTLF